MQRESSSTTLKIGGSMPAFKLIGVDGKSYDNKYFSEGTLKLIVFTCNHCPYVKGTEQLLVETAKKYEVQGLKVIAISANDALNYPEDSFENMQKRATELKLPYPYLYDESQSVAKSFDAQCTPECYLFDKNSLLIFQGPITDRPREPHAQRANLLAAAIEQALLGNSNAQELGYHNAIGCSIKWRG